MSSLHCNIFKKKLFARLPWWPLMYGQPLSSLLPHSLWTHGLSIYMGWGIQQSEHQQYLHSQHLQSTVACYILLLDAHIIACAVHTEPVLLQSSASLIHWSRLISTLLDFKEAIAKSEESIIIIQLLQSKAHDIPYNGVCWLWTLTNCNARK